MILNRKIFNRRKNMARKQKQLTAGILGLLLSYFLCTPAHADEIRICGFLQAINSNGVTVNDITYPLTQSTELKDENDQTITIADFDIGGVVKVEIENGVVDEVEKEAGLSCSSDDNSNSNDDDEGDDDNSNNDDDGDDDNSNGDDNTNSGPKQRICGSIDAITGADITVKGITYPFTSSTEFESLSGQNISPEAFAVGDFVKIKLVGGILDEVEFENSASCKAYKQSKKAKKNGFSQTTKTRKDKQRASTISAEPSVSGKARYRTEATSKLGRDPRVTSRFVVNTKILVGEGQPILQSSGQAATLSLQAFITRNGAHMAVCTLVFDEINDEGQAEYKVQLREKRGALIEKKGSCNIDPAAPSGVAGLPAIQSGDIVTVYNTDGLVDIITMSF